MAQNPSRTRFNHTVATRYEKSTGIRKEFIDGELVNTSHYGYEGDSEYISQSRYCGDTVGYWNSDNPLDIEVIGQSPASYEGFHTNIDDYGGGYSDENIEEFDVSLPVNQVLYSDEQNESDVEFVTKAAAVTNPSTAAVQGLVFAAELRDLPSLFRSAGKDISKFGANEYLKYQYGWKPMINDLRKAFTMVDKVTRRLNVLNRLDKESGLRRKFSATEIGPEVKIREFVPDFPVVYAGGGVVHNRVVSRMTTTRWCDVVWKAIPPDTVLPTFGQDNLAKARHVLFGLNLDGPTLWQAMPWSWLIDWTYNVSDYVKSQNNVVGAEFSRAVLMKTTEIESEATPFYSEPPTFNGVSHGTFSPGRAKYVRKQRILGLEPTVVNTGEYTAILGSEFKTSIVTALGIQRFHALRSMRI